MMGKNWFFLTIALLFLIGCNQVPVVEEATATPAPAEAGEPTATAVSPGVTILAEGQIEVVQPALPLGFETGGKLLTVVVQPGDIVQAGDLIATLDEAALQEAIANALLQVDQAENSLAQAQLTLNDLLNWEADETAVVLAEANLAAAETALAKAQTQDASAGNSLTSARIGIEQAERGLADAQRAYDTAFDPGREWEFLTHDATCLPGQDGDFVPCSGPSFHILMKNEREGADRAVAFAEENLEVARAQYNLAAAGLNNDTAVSAEANVVAAQQSLDQALRGPKEAEIEAAQLRVEQAEITLAQSQLSLTQAEAALADTELLAPWTGTVLSLEASPGALVGGGTPIVTLLDLTQLEFHTNNLSERDLAQISPGLAAVVTLKSYPNDPLSGAVVRIGLQAGTAVGDAATFPVMIALDATDLDIRAGMTGRAEISRGE